MPRLDKSAMRNRIKKITLSVLSLITLLVIIWQTEPPKTLFEITPLQTLLFFVPLLTFLASGVSIVVKSKLVCIIITLVIFVLLILRGIDQLNTLTVVLISTLLVLILVISLKKTRHPQLITQTKVKSLLHKF